MALKLVVLCAVLSMNWEASGARVHVLATKYSSSRKHFVSAESNATNCDYQQLAKTYTLCSVPFYADFIGTFESNQSSCSSVEKFQSCLAATLAETRCANDTALLTPTIRVTPLQILPRKTWPKKIKRMPSEQQMKAATRVRRLPQADQAREPSPKVDQL